MNFWFKPLKKIPNIALWPNCWILAFLCSAWAAPLIFILKNRSCEPIRIEHFSVFILKTKKIPVVILGFFLARAPHFGIWLIAHCVCAGCVCCARIAQPIRYRYDCIDCEINLHACVAKFASEAFVFVPKNTVIYALGTILHVIFRFARYQRCRHLFSPQ